MLFLTQRFTASLMANLKCPSELPATDLRTHLSLCTASANCFVQHQPSHQRNQDLIGFRCRTRTISLRLARSRNDSACGWGDATGSSQPNISIISEQVSEAGLSVSRSLFQLFFMISVTVTVTRHENPSKSPHAPPLLLPILHLQPTSPPRRGAISSCKIASTSHIHPHIISPHPAAPSLPLSSRAAHVAHPSQHRRPPPRPQTLGESHYGRWAGFGSMQARCWTGPNAKSSRRSVAADLGMP